MRVANQTKLVMCSFFQLVTYTRQGLIILFCIRAEKPDLQEAYVSWFPFTAVLKWPKASTSAGRLSRWPAQPCHQHSLALTCAVSLSPGTSSLPPDLPSLICGLSSTSLTHPLNSSASSGAANLNFFLLYFYSTQILYHFSYLPKRKPVHPVPLSLKSGIE